MNIKKPVILCVDDETLIIDALKEQLLRNFGDEFTIETSENGDEAIEFFQELMNEKREVPVVIADYIMPGLKGDALLAEIHKKSPGTHNILLTGQANIEGVTNAVNYANLYRFICKPWDQEDLCLTIREAVKSYNLEKKIKQYNQELAELNASLEIKVKQRTQELQELNATKDKFFSIIAHDLKNPFNALVGFSSYLVDHYTETTDNDRLEFLGAMREAADNAYKLLQNLLEWSRIHTGRMKCLPEKIYLSAIISESIDLLQKSAENKGLNVYSTVADNEVAFADENMVKTVIRNLLSNAIKYSEKGGDVKVEAKHLDKMIQLCFTDQGVGIKKTNLHKLFKIDESFSTRGTHDEQGTGIGLILCKEFIEKNGGEIMVKSQFGQGSAFCFTLPQVPPDKR